VAVAGGIVGHRGGGRRRGRGGGLSWPSALWWWWGASWPSSWLWRAASLAIVVVVGVVVVVRHRGRGSQRRGHRGHVGIVTGHASSWLSSSSSWPWVVVAVGIVVVVRRRGRGHASWPRWASWSWYGAAALCQHTRQGAHRQVDGGAVDRNGSLACPLPLITLCWAYSHSQHLTGVFRTHLRGALRGEGASPRGRSHSTSRRVASALV
jgi:hypothetical protein